MVEKIQKKVNHLKILINNLFGLEERSKAIGFK